MNFSRVAVLYILIFLIQPASAYEKDGDTYKVKLQLKWKHQFQFAGYYAAIEKGFFKDVGIEVELMEPQPGENSNEIVAKGLADFGISNTDILLYRDKGAELVVLASIFQHSPLVLVVSEESGIKYVQDLVGKKIEMEEHAADIITYMKEEGVDLEDCFLSNHKFNIDNLINKDIDAITAYVSDELFLLSQSDFQYSVLSPMMGGIDFYGDILFASKQLIKENPKLVSDFRSASLKGWQYSFENKDEIIDVIYSKYSQRHSKAHLFFEANQMEHIVMPNVVELGYSNRGRWEHILDVYKKTGLIGKNNSTKGLLFVDYFDIERKINWKLLLVYLLTIMLPLLLAYVYYRAYKRIKTESSKRLIIQNNLIKSEQKLIEEKKTRDKLYSIIAHDLKSPLASIVSFSDLLISNQNGELSEELKGDLIAIKETSESTFNLLENLLHWANSQIGNIEFRPENNDLNDIIKNVIQELSSFAQNKKIELVVHSGLQQSILLDKTMISIVLRNLISNAIKFSYPNSQIHIKVFDETKNIKISVADSGKGISADKKKNLFKIDSVVSTKGTANEKGSGLGLILCKEFVEKHAGTISMDSIESEGSTFIFTLPYKK